MTNKYLVNDQRGVALFTVVLIFLVLVTMLGGVMFATVANQRNSILAKDHTAVYYAAESGLNLEMAKLEGLFKSTTTQNWSSARLFNEIMLIGNNRRYDFSENMGKASWANTSVAPSPVDYSVLYPGYVFFRVTSTGYIGDVSRLLYSDVGYKISLGPGKLFTFAGAVIAKEGIIVDKGDAVVIGPIASNMENGATISLNNTTTCHGITAINIPVADFGDVSGCSVTPKALTQKIVFSDITMPNRTLLRASALTPNLVINPNVGILDLRRSNIPYGSRIFTLDQLIGTSEKNNDPKVLTIKLNGIDEREPIYVLLNNEISTLPDVITVQGEGRLIVIAQFSGNTYTLNSKIRYDKDGDGIVDSIDKNGDGIIDGKDYDIDPSKFNLVLFKRDDVTPGPGIQMQNGDVFAGSVLSNSLGDVSLKGKFGGYFVTMALNVQVQTPNSQSGTPENTIWVYAPNAEFEMIANSLIYGSIMSETFSSTNPANRLIFQDLSGIYPFEPWTPLPYTVDQSDAQAELAVKFLPIIEN